ncbi:MAG: hypothetical protein HOO06_15805 [Bdellovibrionaceae bacterium]|jgi:hypothetical protein|nr:hypothetical protein [Pseudobdellovibrionaceae bacterium]
MNDKLRIKHKHFLILMCLFLLNSPLCFAQSSCLSLFSAEYNVEPLTRRRLLRAVVDLNSNFKTHPRYMQRLNRIQKKLARMMATDQADIHLEKIAEINLKEISEVVASLGSKPMSKASFLNYRRSLERTTDYDPVIVKKVNPTIEYVKHDLKELIEQIDVYGNQLYVVNSIAGIISRFKSALPEKLKYQEKLQLYKKLNEIGRNLFFVSISHFLTESHSPKEKLFFMKILRGNMGRITFFTDYEIIRMAKIVELFWQLQEKRSPRKL